MNSHLNWIAVTHSLHRWQADVDLRYVTIDQSVCKRIVGVGPKLYTSQVDASLKWLQTALGEAFAPFLKKITPFLRSLPPMTLCGFELTLCDPNKVVDALENGTRGKNGRLCAKLDGLGGILRALGTLDKPAEIHIEYCTWTSQTRKIRVIVCAGWLFPRWRSP